MSPLRRQSDEDLARAAGGGDERAFTLLFERYGSALYRYCRSIVRHDQDAQDVVQTTMVQALAALRKAPLDAPLKPWLFKIAHNESITLLRKRRPTDDLDAQWDVAGAPVEGKVEDRERLANLVTDLRELPERQRSALVLRELSGLSHDEIAVALGITISQTKQAIFEARRSLEAAAVGRDMACEPVQRAISDGDGRVLRARHMRSHVRTCTQCRAMRDAIRTRERDLAVLYPPLPVAAAGTILDRIAAAGTSNGDAVAGGVAGAAATATAGHALAGALSGGKVLAIVAALVTAGGAATYVAERPPSGGSGSGPVASADPHAVLVAGGPLLGPATTAQQPAQAGTGAAPGSGSAALGLAGHGGHGALGAHGPAGATLPALPGTAAPGATTPGSTAPGTGGGSSSSGGGSSSSGGGSSSGVGGGGGGTSGSSPSTGHSGSSTPSRGGATQTASSTVNHVVSTATSSVQHVTDGAGAAVHDTTSGVSSAVHDTAGTVGTVVHDVTSGASPGQTVKDVTDGAGTIVKDVTGAATSATKDLVGGLTKATGGLLTPKKP